MSLHYPVKDEISTSVTKMT